MISPSSTSNANASVWEFTIFHSKRPDENVRACGSIFYTDSAEEIHELAERSGLKVREHKVDKLAVERDGAFPVQTSLRVREPEDSKALRAIIDSLRSTYGVDLAQESLITNASRYFFSIRKVREFTESEVNQAPLLQIFAKRFQIGSWVEPTEEEYLQGLYAVENDSKQRTKVRFGFLSPFPAIGVDQGLKEQLERHSLTGLAFRPISVRKNDGVPRKPIWSLTSSIVLPRTGTRFINQHGYDKEPFDDWSDRWESAFFYDSGYEPPKLGFEQEELDCLGAFDVAVTAERAGNGPKISFPSVIVSQRFREVLSELKVVGVGYIPVATN